MPTSMPLYKKIASVLSALDRCIKANKQEWIDRYMQTLDDLEKCLPHGSGFDEGSHLWYGKSTPERLVIHTAYHHMTEDGMYDRWTFHDVIVTPSLQFGFTLRVTGRDYKGIKEYIGEYFSEVLAEEVATS